MTDISTDNGTVPTPDSPPITLESLAHRLDALGKQMDWLCENMQSLFLFVQTVGQNGGGIRGMLQTLRHAPPELLSQQSNQDLGVSQ